MRTPDSLHRLIACRGSLLMGIINVTDDSFSDGGRFLQAHDALRRRNELAAAKTEIIDVGAESTRPGATPLTARQEMTRLLPVLEAFREVPCDGCFLSVDTYHPETAVAAAKLGMDILNDVQMTVEMAEVAAEYGCYLVLMAPSLEPDGDAVEQVKGIWKRGMEQALRSGVARDRLIFDPGLGFHQTYEQSWDLVHRIGELAGFGPRLAGHSRKRFIGAASGISDPSKRDEASCDVARRLVADGVEIIRMHRPELLRRTSDGIVLSLK